MGLGLGFITHGVTAKIAEASWYHAELLQRLSCMVRDTPELVDFTFSSVQVNINVSLPMHVDNDVVGSSLVFSGGDFEGGDFMLGSVPTRYQLRGKALVIPYDVVHGVAPITSGKNGRW